MVRGLRCSENSALTPTHLPQGERPSEQPLSVPIVRFAFAFTVCRRCPASTTISRPPPLGQHPTPPRTYCEKSGLETIGVLNTLFHGFDIQQFGQILDGQGTVGKDRFVEAAELEVFALLALHLLSQAIECHAADEVRRELT